MGTPVRRQTLSARSSKTCAKGKNPRNTSSGLISTASQKAFSVEMMFSWDRSTPFGTPVEPDVYIMIAVSLDCGGDIFACELLPTWITSENGISLTPSWKMKAIG